MQDDALDGLAAEAYSPAPGLVAANRSDMYAFITLAGFFAELLPQLPPAAFARYPSSSASYDTCHCIACTCT